MSKVESLEKITHVEITERVPDLMNGGTNLPGVYPVEEIFYRTNELSFWVNSEVGGKEISRQLTVDPTEPILEELPVTFHQNQ